MGAVCGPLGDVTWAAARTEEVDRSGGIELVFGDIAEGTC